MKEMLFKGKSIEENKWVYGYYMKEKNQYFIISQEDIFLTEVYKDSIGQWTGRYDKNGVKIFERDVIKTPYSTDLLTVKYSEQETRYIVCEPKITDYFLPMMMLGNNEVEIIDNQFDETQREKKYYIK